MAINTELYEQLKKENDKLILKETKTHNDNVSLQSKIEELGEIIIGMGSEIKKLNEENEELKEENEKLKITDETCLNICELIEDKLPTNYQHEDIIKYITELKVKNKKLEDEVELNAKRNLHHQLILFDYFEKKVDNVEGITFNQSIVNYCEKLKEENRILLEKLEQKKTKSINRQKYIHYKNIVLKNELGDVSDFEDEDYIGFGEKPYSKSKDLSSKSGSM